MKTKMFRQGDVLLREVKSIPKTAKREKRTGPIVLALGEVTGHKHQILDPDVEVFVKSDGTMYLKVDGEAALQHEEHGTIVLPAGNYERVQQREYSPEANRNVAD
jgi:hypothetical protein